MASLWEKGTARKCIPTSHADTGTVPKPRIFRSTGRNREVHQQSDCPPGGLRWNDASEKFPSFDEKLTVLHCNKPTDTPLSVGFSLF